MLRVIRQGLGGALKGSRVNSYVLKKIEHSWTAGIKPVRADAEFYYIGLRDGLPMVNEFCDHLSRVLVDFCLPRSEIQQAKDKYKESGDETVFYALSNKARGLFIRAQQQTKRSGEGGELILYNILESIGAPQIISKMYLKTATEMPVHGSDGLHIGPADPPNEIAIYLGESKLIADYDNSLADALKSVVDLRDNALKLEREFNLITDHIDEKSFPADFLSILNDYINPYSERAQKRKEVHACLIGFDFIAYEEVAKVDPKDSENEFLKKVTDFAEEKLNNLAKRLGREKYNNINFVFFFLPVPSVEEFRKAFNRKVLGID